LENTYSSTQSILGSIVKLLGIDEESGYFDRDLIIHINSIFLTLTQLGIGPPSGFNITDLDDTWSGMIGDREDLEAIKTYVYLKVRLLFDPPQTGYLVDALKEQCKELEWRLNLQVEGGK